MYEATRGLNMK